MTNEHAIEILKSKMDGTVDTSYEWCETVRLAIQALNNQNKIVHCKDCKYSHMTYDGECKYCEIHSPEDTCYFPSDYYCASGELV